MAQVTIATGFDVDYYLDQVGADYYLTAAGEPPGVWAGAAAPGLGLAGTVDPAVMRGLYHHDVAPDGTLLGTSQRSPQYQARRSYQQVQEAIEKRIADLGPVLATPEKVREIRLQERARTRTRTPYYDMTFSAEKSVSLAYAAARAAAARARDEDREADAEQYEAHARSVEAAVMAGAEAMLAHAEQRAAIVRTGHHSANSGEYRDAAGFVAAKFLQHTSRSDDPQLHVQIPVLNRAQRADGADGKWRALDGRQLWAERLGAAAAAGIAEARALARLGLPLVKRPDGYGYEVGGVSRATMDAFSARSADIAAQLAARIAEYEQMYGRPPSRAALYKLRKRVTVETRAAKRKPPAEKRNDRDAQADAAEAELEAWARRAADEHVQALESLHEDIAAYAAEHPEALPSEMPTAGEREEIARAAVAEVQRQNACWTRAKIEFELYRQMPVLPAGADWAGFLSGLADDILTGRMPGVTVLQIAPVPDVVDVSRLGFRKDGTSVYRKPGEARYVTAGHLDLEEWVLSHSKAAAPQLVTGEAAAAAIAASGLDYDQAAAAKGMLTSQQAVTSLIAPAGTGKTRTMAQFARAWTAETGCRVIGLTLSENAARVMATEGMAEAWNIAKFFANQVPVYRGDVLAVDEASQASTADLARIINLARQAGARVILTGDPQQLGPVEAGGMFRLIAAESGHWKLAEVRRFTESWERKASIQLRAGELAAWGEYGSRGRVWEGPQDRVYDRAAGRWLTDTAEGKTSLLLTGSNEEAARLAALVRARRIEQGEIPAAREITLSDGNAAGTGDLVRARLNTRIDAGGRPLANRDTLRIEGWLGTGQDREAVAVRQDPDAAGGWSARFTVPASYLEQNAELGYAGNVYVAQGRTVDTAHLVIAEGMTRDMLYVGMTRGRERNQAHVVTGPPDPADMTRAERDAYLQAAIPEAAQLAENGDIAAAVDRMQVPEPEGTRERAPWESVVAAAMERQDPPATAIENMRAAQEVPVNTRHLYEIAEAYWWQDIVPQIDQLILERIGDHDYQRYLRDPERPALLQTLREHEIGGRPIPGLLDAITARPLDGARSIAAVLHGRAGKEPAPTRGQTKTWGDRIPQAWANPPQAIQETYQALDGRQAELGEQLASRPPQWALEAWGQPPAENGTLREDWKQRAALVQSYRELAGITDPAQAIGPPPARQAGLTEAFAASIRALELPDNAAMLKAMGRGDLEARVREYERAQALAPADVRADIDRTDAALLDAAEQAKTARAAGNEAMVRRTADIAKGLAERRERLRVAEAARQEWAEATAAQADAAEQAQAELRRRGPARPGAGQGQGEPQRDTPALDPAEAARWQEAHRQKVAEIRDPNRTVRGPEPETERTPPPMEAERRAGLKAAQTARVEADRQERREAAARAVPATEEEIARYGAAAENLAQADPEAAAALDRIQASADAAHAAISRRTETEARREAELEEAGINKPVTHAEAGTEAEAESAWEPGTAASDPGAVRAAAEADTGMEI